jgi:flavin reductase (DIM6/NTAB) family NADH-FMN oxidoreductase RutF
MTFDKTLDKTLDESLFKRGMARWTSGVTIVTTRAGDQIHGMTVSDFSGASLSPMLVTVCCNVDSITTKLIAEGGCFAVNILAADQQELSNKFASKSQEMVRFEGLSCDEAETGAPLIPGAVVQIDCTLAATHPAGDHVVYLGEVKHIAVFDKTPLVYVDGQYRELAPSDG